MGGYSFIGVSGWFRTWYLVWSFPYAIRGGDSTLSTLAITFPLAIALVDDWYAWFFPFRLFAVLMLVVTVLIFKELRPLLLARRYDAQSPPGAIAHEAFGGRQPARRPRVGRRLSPTAGRDVSL